MRPSRLVIDGLRSYRTRNVVDFTDKGLCAVVGDTGAGKSSILEAMVFALYGGSTFTGHAGSLVCDARDQMRVALEFQVDGTRWRVERVMWHRDATHPSIHKLEQLDTDGGTVRTVTGGRQVTDRIEQLVGLDRDAFLKSVLLPQGRFAELLTATPARRSAVLKSVFGLDELEEAAVQLRELADNVGNALQIVRARRQELGEDPAGAAATAAAEAATAEAALQALRETEVEVHTAAMEAAASESDATQLRRAAQVVEETLARLDQLSATVGRDGTSRDGLFADLQRRRDAISAQIADLEGKERQVRARQRQLSEDLAARQADGLGQGALVTVQGALTQVPTVAARLTSTLVEHAELTSRRIRLQEEHAAAEKAELAAATAAAEAEDQLARARVEQQAALDRLREAVHRTDRAVVAWRDLVAAREAATAADEAHRLAQADAESAEASLQAAEAALEEAKATLEAAMDADRAAALAAHLHAGDTCPVCTSTVPEGFRPAGPTEDVRAARQAVENAQKACAKARSVAKKADTAAARAGAEAKSAATAAERCQKEARTTLQALQELVPAATHATLVGRQVPTATQPPSLLDDPLLGALATAIPTPDETAAVHAREAAAQAGTRVTQLDSQIGEAGRGLDRCAEEADRNQTQLGELITLIPERFRPDGLTVMPADAASVGHQLAAVDAAAPLQAVQDELSVTARLEQEGATAGRELDHVMTRQRELTQQMQHEVAGPLEQLRGEVRVLTGRLRDVPTVDDLPDAPEGDEPSQLRDAVATLDDRCRDAHQRLVDRAATAQQRADGHHQAVVVLVQKVLPDIDLTSMAEGAARAHAAHEQINRRLQDVRTTAEVSRQTAQRLAKVAERADRLDTAMRAAAPLVQALQTLKGLLTTGRFISHVVNVRQTRLLAVATERLREMTDGRYGFTATFDLLDTLTGRARGADTLSGGEKFLASLALSLAMVEIAGSAGGKIDAIFLDEGFGALDADSLNEALDLLEQQAADGRLLVVISHLKAVAERIGNVLHVTADATGASTVEWLDDTQRAAIVEEEAAGAVSGLLT